MGEQYNSIRNNSALLKTLPANTTTKGSLIEGGEGNTKLIRERRAVAGLDKTLSQAKEKANNGLKTYQL
jgi:hypothetical protein